MSDLAGHLDKKPPHRPIDSWKLYFFSDLDKYFSMIFRTRRRLLKATVRSMYKISRYDGSAITKDLEFEYTPYSETLKRIVERYLSESTSTED
jgi:dihydroflavonol-4-reductase